MHRRPPIMVGARLAPILKCLPASIDGRVRAAAWASLAAEVLIIGTGAAVRLTGSGLGCPTWPRCTETSFVSTPEMGVHGVIEFGNRLLTFLLVVVAVAAFLAVVRMRRERRDLFVLAVVQVLSIPAQAVLGGITVWTGLNPWVVAAHFVFSLGLVATMTVFVHRVRVAPGPRGLAVPPWFAAFGLAAAAAAAVALALGVTTTGSGPHAGDEGAARNGLDAVLLVEMHTVAAYTLAGLTVVLTVGALVVPLRTRTRRAVLLLLGVELAQIAVGVTQVRMDWAAQLVIVHVFLAALLAAATTGMVLALRGPVVLDGGAVPDAPRAVVAS